MLTLKKSDVDIWQPNVKWTDAEIEWTDTAPSRMELRAQELEANTDKTTPEVPPLVGGRAYRYCLTSVDTAGNESLSSSLVQTVAVDNRVPDPPAWSNQVWLLRNDADGTLTDWPEDNTIPAGHSPVLRVRWRSSTTDPQFLISRKMGIIWDEVVMLTHVVPLIGDLDTYEWVDIAPVTDEIYDLAIKVRAGNGLWSTDADTMQVGGLLR
jgi:hypothetical protein